MLSNRKNMIYSTSQKNLRTSPRFAFYKLRELSSNACPAVFASAPSFFDIGDKLIQSIFIAFKGHHIDLIALFEDPNR